MNAYIFVVHHDCSYVDGMAIINALDYNQAKTILRRTTWADTMRPGQGSWNDDTLKKRIINDKNKGELDSILAEYPEKLPKDRGYHNVWCLIDKIPINANKATSTGLKTFAYHDG